MPLKRRNHGRGKKHKGCADCVNCYNCGRVYPKDKAIKRYNMRKIVDASSKRDIEEATAYPGNLETKFIKQYRETFCYPKTLHEDLLLCELCYSLENCESKIFREQKNSYLDKGQKGKYNILDIIEYFQIKKRDADDKGKAVAA